jgi:hypothetical protein
LSQPHEVAGTLQNPSELSPVNLPCIIFLLLLSSVILCVWCLYLTQTFTRPLSTCNLSKSVESVNFPGFTVKSCSHIFIPVLNVVCYAMGNEFDMSGVT